MGWETLKCRGDGYSQQKAMVFLVADMPVGPYETEVAFPWLGRIQQVQVNAQAPSAVDTKFYVEQQGKVEYRAQANNWQRVDGQLFVLPAGEVYTELPVTGSVMPGDVFRLYCAEGGTSSLTIQIIITLEE